ncbi:hypothetical protein [Corallococcus terminator]|uniref:hypothetical protein n=1 Tax=Corallococcus terminator TaxID=2316733 RepID=UPI00131547E3|nr:hypothetical protein [Corallococcus terminator]
MTALAGRGDALAGLLLSAASGTGPATHEHGVVTGEARYQDEVSVGGKLNAGGRS